MRRFFCYFIVACILVTVFSCSEKAGPEAPKYVTLSIDVSVDTTGTETKTYMDGETGYVKWSPTDSLTVYFRSVTLSPVKTGPATDIRNDGRTATFYYQVKESDYEKVYNSNKYVYYGKQELTTDEDYNPTSVKLDACQEYAGNNCFSEYENISLGYLKKGDYDTGKRPDSVCVMKNLFGILRVNIQLSDTDKQIDFIQLTDNKIGNYLAGEFTIGNLPTYQNPDNNPTLTHKENTGGESLTIEKRVPKDSTLLGGGTFYFMVPPGTLLGTAEGFNLLVYTEDGYYSGKKIKVAEGKGKIERSVITTVPVSTFSPKPIPVSPRPTANCYIIPATAGIHTIPAEYMGNAFQGNGDDIAARDSRYHITSGSYAEFLWQTRNNGDKMSGTEVVCCPVFFERDGSHYISFQCSGIEGNALVALKSSDGTILWSWHLWITSETDITSINRGIQLNNNAGYIMDRNLGSLSIDLSTGTQTHGLHYQYGRKDPFMGSQKVVLSNAGSSYGDYMEMWPPQAIDLGTIALSVAESIKQPKLRVTSEQNSWCSENVYWGKQKGIDSLSTSPKTLYDPCPVGWRTVEEAVVAAAIADPSTQALVLSGDVIDATGGAVAFKLTSASSEPILFPSTGYSPSNNSLIQVGTNIYLWGATATKAIVGKLNTQAYHLLLSTTASKSYSGSFPVANMCASMPVRCVKWHETSPSDNATVGSAPYVDFGDL